MNAAFALAPVIGLVLGGAPLATSVAEQSHPEYSHAAEAPAATLTTALVEETDPGIRSSYRFVLINESSEYIRFESVDTDRFEGRPGFGEILAPQGRHFFEVQWIPFQTNAPKVWYSACGPTGSACVPGARDVGAVFTVGPAGPIRSSCVDVAAAPISCTTFQYRYGDHGVEIVSR